MLSPVPFIVGSPRSGTTLLRLMLDSHPAIAIPPETGFLRDIAKAGRRRADAGVGSPASPAEILRRFTRAERWADFKLDPIALEERVATLRPFNVSEACRAFYRLYAARFGKSRYGDKTPGYVFVMEDIQALLPEAHFIHLIRDGRDAALSLRHHWFSAGPDMTVQAEHWARHVQAGRASASKVNHYLEVRFEDLVVGPQDTLRRLCDFLKIGFDPGMLRYHERAASRLQEHEGRTLPDGRILTKAQRFAQQHRTTMPLQRELAGGWREKMTAPEIAAFEAVAGGLLHELGYALGAERCPSQAAAANPPKTAR
jgi:Sulfotransferase family